MTPMRQPQRKLPGLSRLSIPFRLVLLSAALLATLVGTNIYMNWELKLAVDALVAATYEYVDGKVAEWVFSGGRGDEISAVNCPAVPGTAVDEIRQALSAGQREVACALAASRTWSRYRGLAAGSLPCLCSFWRACFALRVSAPDERTERPPTARVIPDPTRVDRAQPHRCPRSGPRGHRPRADRSGRPDARRDR